MELPTTRLARTAGLLLIAGCVGTPSVSGVPGASPSPDVPWTPPRSSAAALAQVDSVAAPALPPDLGERIRRFTLAEIVELGLRNNPATREAWANAQSAAAVHMGRIITWDEMIKSQFRFAPDTDQLTGASRAPVQADEQGRYPTPVPGKWVEV